MYRIIYEEGFYKIQRKNWLGKWKTKGNHGGSFGWNEHQYYSFEEAEKALLVSVGFSQQSFEVIKVYK